MTTPRTTPTPRTDKVEREHGLAWFGINDDRDRWIDAMVRFRECARELETALSLTEQGANSAFKIMQDARDSALRDLAARDAELAEYQSAFKLVKSSLAGAVQRAEAAERELAALKAENSKLRSALEIVHFKREPWQ